VRAAVVASMVLRRSSYWRCRADSLDDASA
jgi:hypothetical protein